MSWVWLIRGFRDTKKGFWQVSDTISLSGHDRQLVKNSFPRKLIETHPYRRQRRGKIGAFPVPMLANGWNIIISYIEPTYIIGL